MAEAFAARWARHPSGPIWRAIYISTRRRAMETAAPFAAALGKVPIVDRGLDEINYGSWQGRTKGEIERDDPDGLPALARRSDARRARRRVADRSRAPRA